jgi:amino acid transporter
MNSDAAAASAKRQLTLFDTICLGINMIVGSGIFLLPGQMAAKMGPSSFVAFLVVGLAMIAVALCYAEVASLYAENGGTYVYARDAFGPAAGFAVGWSAYISSLLSWSAVAGGATQYLGEVWPAAQDPTLRAALALLLIVVLGVLNYIGIKPAAWTMNVFTFAKLAPLFLFAIVGMIVVPFDRISWHVTGLGAGAFIAIFPCQGFENVPVPAGETRNPKRSIPIATLGSLAFAIALYVVIQIVATCSVGSEKLAASKAPLAFAAQSFLGKPGANLIAVCAVLSMVGYNCGVALITPRYISAMASDGLLPAPVAAIHRRFLTPHVAIVITTLGAAVFAVTLDYDSLVILSVVTSGLMYFATCLAVPVLRRRRPELTRVFRLPGGWLVPAIGCAVVVALMTQASGKEFLWGVVLVACGLLFRAVHVWGRRLTGRQDPPTAIERADGEE